MKTKIHKILGVTLALVLVFGLVGAFIPVNQAEAQAYTPNQWNTMTIPSATGSVLRACDVADFAVGSDGNTIYAITGLGELGYWNDTVGITSAWATTPTPQSGTSSAKLIRSASGVGSVYVEFVPAGGITVNSLASIASTPEWSFYYWLEDVAPTNRGPQLELLFTDPDSVGYVEVTLMALQGAITRGEWVKVDVLAASERAIWYGVDETGSGIAWDDTSVFGLDDIETDLNAETNVTACGNWQLTRVRMELWEPADSGTRYCYIDDVTINGVTYDPEQGAILRSTTGGQTFTALVTPADAVLPLKLVTVSPDDPLAVAVVDSADVVFYSSNGGAVWTDLGANWTNDTEVVYDIAISIIRSTAILGRDIAVATSDPAADAYGDVYTVGTTTTWGAVGLGASAEYDYTSVTFEPNWVGGRAIVAVGHDAATSYLYVVRTSTPVTMIINTAMSVTAVDMPVEVGASVDGVISSSLALPNDFDSTTAPAIQAYIGFTSAAGYDDVYRVDLSQTRKLGIAANVGIHSISFLGSRAGGNLFAGESAATQVHYSADPQTAMPTWSYSFKPPTGQFNTVVAMAPDFGASATVYAGTSGAESAFSRTANGGVSYNQLSLIDTTISTLADVMPTPDNSAVFLSTSFTATNSSLWKSSTPPSAGSWERVRLRATVGYIIRLSPDYLDDTTLYWCDDGVDGRDIQKSNTGGDIFANRTAPADIADLTVESQDIVYMGSGTSIYASTNGAWFFGLPIIAQVQGVHSLAMAPTYPDKPVAGNVLCGGTNGGVSLSTDGASFIPLSASSATGAMQVLGDKNYATNNLVYAGSFVLGQGIYRYEVGVSTAWEQIHAVSADDTERITGLAMHCGALYAAYDSTDILSGADRSLSPFLPDIAALTFDRMNVGSAAAQFNVTPSALRIAGGETDVWLWAIDTVSDNALMGYNDTMAKTAPAVTVPSDVRFDPNTGGNAAFTITWNKVSNALGYHVEIYTDAAHTQRVAAAPYNFSMGVRPAAADALDCYAPPDALSPTWSVLANTIPSGATYYVRACVRDQVPADAIRSPWGDVESFTVETGVPVMAPGVGPTLLGPIPGSMNVPLRPGFSWGPMAGTTAYEFILATDAALSSPIAGTPVKVTTPSWQCPEDLAYNTTYFWGIKASEPAVSAQSIGTFTTIGEAAAPPAPPAPPTPAAPVVTPGIIWAIIAIGAILVIAVIVLILRTRRIA